MISKMHKRMRITAKKDEIVTAIPRREGGTCVDGFSFGTWLGVTRPLALVLVCIVTVWSFPVWMANNLHSTPLYVIEYCLIKLQSKHVGWMHSRQHPCFYSDSMQYSVAECMLICIHGGVLTYVFTLLYRTAKVHSFLLLCITVWPLYFRKLQPKQARSGQHCTWIV